MSSICIRLASAVLALFIGLSWNGKLPPLRLTSSAEAVIGAPLTPMSYAGVARRTTRRAVAATPQPVVVGPGCAQVVNSYGQVTYRC